LQGLFSPECFFLIDREAVAHCAESFHIFSDLTAKNFAMLPVIHNPENEAHANGLKCIVVDLG